MGTPKAKKKKVWALALRSCSLKCLLCHLIGCVTSGSSFTYESLHFLLTMWKTLHTSKSFVRTQDTQSTVHASLPSAPQGQARWSSWGTSSGACSFPQNFHLFRTSVCAFPSFPLFSTSNDDSSRSPFPDSFLRVSCPCVFLLLSPQQGGQDPDECTLGSCLSRAHLSPDSTHKTVVREASGVLAEEFPSWLSGNESD